jgi:beta-glucanase (GH16 family)
LIDLIPEECQDIAINDGWVPVFCDEFETSMGASIVDPDKWIYDVGTGNWGWGNNEDQTYTYRDSDNIKVEDGYLKIIALRENFNGKEYTSARIKSKTNLSWTYGKIEMRAKLPAGRGTWAAFWMLPRNSTYGGWPDSGEIDIMEYVGYDKNMIHGAVHTDRFNGTNNRGDSVRPSFDVETEFHNYSVIWEAGKIEWFVDDVSFAVVEFDPNLNRNSFQYPVNVDWPFDKPFYIILNLAIGGNWGGALGIDDTIFPTEFVIDYVRVYQKDYVSNDLTPPGMPTNVRTLYKSGTTAFLTWTPSVDDQQIKQYWVYVNGIFTKFTSVWGVQLTNLPVGADNLISIIAEDYAGNLSPSFDTIVTT